MDYNIVYVALPDIGRALGFSSQSLQWVVSAYAVVFGGFLLCAGRVVDRLGARRAFVAGLVVFGVACLVGGLATSPGVLVAARAVRGVGGALLTPATLALISTTFAEGPERTRALSVWGAAGSGGLAAGALLGGVLTDALGWEWTLFVLVPLSLGAAVLAFWVLPADRTGGVRQSFDVPGAVLATAGSVLLVFGLVSGPEAGWVRGGLALAGGVVLLGVFVAVERRTRDPLVPLRLFGNRALVSAIGVVLLFQSSLGGAYYLFTTYLQDQLGYRPLAAVSAFVPLTLVSMTASLKGTGAAIARWGVRVTLVVGMVVNGVGIALLAAAMAWDGGFWLLLPGLLVWGIGGGLTFPAMFVAAASGVADAEQGVASALTTTSQQVGGAMGLAVLIALAGTGFGAAGALAVGGLATVVGGAVLAFGKNK
ncbi:MFS transporter [Saccharothrix sp. ALI-22-I]|uniref:MFS transporter n=1 Tax=Saccharothrix sp. ALI-22-I TaxID=1933778 RepID=UPI00097C3B2B|nr:MFS transporter [Saccharothrix sp. ALI-22-I]